MEYRLFLGMLAMLAASPASAATFLWAGPSSFASATQQVAPVWADTLQFLSGGPSVAVPETLAFLNVRVTRTAGTGSVTYRRSFAISGGEGGAPVSLSALGPLTLGGGTITAISFECALCSPGADPFQGFADARLALIDSAAPPAQAVDAVPEPGTWLAMLVGFGAVGLIARARRRQRTAIVTG